MTAQPPRRLLLVEDDASQRELYGRALRAAGFDVVDVPGLVAAAAAPGPFDIIVSDWDLKPGSAADVATHWPDVPMLVVSGYDRPKEWLGRWFQKPFRTSDLVDLVLQEFGA